MLFHNTRTIQQIHTETHSHAHTHVGKEFPRICCTRVHRTGSVPGHCAFPDFGKWLIMPMMKNYLHSPHILKSSMLHIVFIQIHSSIYLFIYHWDLHWSRSKGASKDLKSSCIYSHVVCIFRLLQIMLLMLFSHFLRILLNLLLSLFPFHHLRGNRYHYNSSINPLTFLCCWCFCSELFMLLLL